MSSPINYNDPYIKKDGTITTMENAGGGGGGSELPSHTVADAGKVLMVDDNNNLIWGTVSGGVTRFAKAISVVPGPQVETTAKGGTT